jgi:hypothetical protein
MAWKKVERIRGVGQVPSIGINRNGDVAMSGGLWGLMGNPARVELLVDWENARLGIRATEDPEAFKPRADQGSSQRAVFFASPSLRHASLYPKAAFRIPATQGDDGIWSGDFAGVVFED